MIQSVEGIYRGGKVELLEPAPPDAAGRVIVTFLLEPSTVDLPSRGINPQHAADLRARLAPFAEDWQRSDMDVYDAL